MEEKERAAYLAVLENVLDPGVCLVVLNLLEHAVKRVAEHREHGEMGSLCGKEFPHGIGQLLLSTLDPAHLGGGGGNIASKTTKSKKIQPLP